MASLQTQDWVTLVRNQVSAIQGYAKVLVDLTVGSVLRAIVEANAAVVVWLEGLLLQVLAITRAATSSGADLDSWVADFGVTRLPAVAATGIVTFSRFTTTQQVLVPVGATVQTADGTQQFTVTIDTTNPAYNAGLGGYVIAAGVGNVTVPVQALTAGAAGNAVAGSVSVIAGAISGVDTVTNTAAFTNAVGYAITSLKQGLVYSLVENQTYAGATQYGYFYVVVDDGTGSPSSTLLATVANAIDAVRPLTSTFGVFAPVVVNASVAMTISTAAGADHAATALVVKNALTSYINALPLGTTLPFSRLAQVAYDASPSVTNVTGVTLNSGTADLTATSQQVIKATSVTVA